MCFPTSRTGLRLSPRGRIGAPAEAPAAFERERASGVPTRSRTHSYLLGVASGLFAKALPVAVGFWLTPFVLGRVGREGFGLYALATSVIAWLALLDLGLTPGLRAHLARRSACPDLEMISRLASSTFFPQLAISLLVLAGGAAVADAAPQWLAVSTALAGDASALTVLLAAAAAVSLATQSFNAVLVAHQHLSRENFSRLLLVAVRALVMAVLLWRDASLAALGVAHLVAVTVSAALNVWWAYRLVPGLRIRRGLVSGAALKPVAGCGGWFSAGAAAGLLISGSDRIVAGKIVSLDAVTVLSVTASAYVFVESAISQVINHARPALGQLFGENRPAAVFRAYRQLVLGAAGLGLIAASSVWAANRMFIEAWVGRLHYGGILLDALLALNCVLALATLPSRALLAAHLTVRPQTMARLVEGALNLMLAVWLTSWLGLIGTVLSTPLAALATSAWYLPRLALRVLGADWRSMRDQLAKLLLFAAATLLAAGLGRAVAASLGGYRGAAAGALFTALCGFAALWTVLLDARARARLTAWPRSFLFPAVAAPAGIAAAD